MKRKFLSLILSFSLAFGLMGAPVYAAPEDEKAAEQSVEGKETEAVTEENDEVMQETTEEKTSDEKKAESKNDKAQENISTYSVDSDAIDVSEITPYSVSADEDVTVDEDNPAVEALANELEETTVEDSEGKSIALTEEQIQNILGLYQQYLDQWEAKANLLGVQLPFFLSYNDNKDGLGILGEMLVLAGHTVDEVRNGDYSYDDLTGMIMNFLYADKYGIDFYGDAIASKRDEAIKAVEDSGAKTDVQKLLVLNDWIAHQATFDMSYIMNMGQDEPVMAAQDGTDITDHEHYDEIYDGMYKVYEEQITKQFHDQIYASVVAQFRQQYYEGAIKQIIYNNAIDNGANEDEANVQAEAFMTENADAISEDAAGFVESTFGQEAANQISAGADEFIEEAETDGVEVDPENAPGYKMTIEEITQSTMENEKILDLDGDGTEETTANQAIPIFAEQAATGLTAGIIGAWEGNHIGILAEGTGVCAGYSKAFAYLLQYMNPEKYGKNGAGTDMSKSENWKTAEDLYYDKDGNLDTNQDYVVDMIRITFDADVSMFGEGSNFGETHFWNAVKVDGKWYYVDPCYTDIYVECMSRDRVEIDGTMNHMYFMFSDDTAREMYDGNMKEIAGLYQGVATDTSYEDSWFARISSNSYSDGNNFYYLYDSTDQLSMMREFGDMEASGGQGDFDEDDFKALMEGSDPDYKLVYHPITSTDVKEGGADSDFTTLIDFNPKNEDDETTKALVRNKDGEMVENDLLTELFAQYKEECEIYPSIKLTTALYDGKLYFNLSNCILSYDLTAGTVEKVKEYNTVYGKRNNSIAFGGMAFTITNSENDADLTVTNHPIAAMTIKEDNKMYVSVATNYAFVSGKSRGSDGVQNIKDSSASYGYEFEESNYNTNYSTYMQDFEIDASQLGDMEYSKETNDNDEFMWSAVIVEKIDMTSSCSHTYEDVSVEPFCGRDGYTESRCTKCGAVNPDKEPTVDEGSAIDHHYVHFDETYYTKDDDGNWNTGDCYVCTICGDAVSEPTEPGEKNVQESDEDYQKRVEEYEKEKAIYDEIVKTAGHTYEPTDAKWSDDSTSVTFSKLECSSVCPEKQSRLDCLVDDNKIAVTLSESVTAEAEVTGSEGKCPTGAKVVYTAAGEADGYKYTATNKVEKEACEHSYEGTFTWTEVTDEDGNPTGEFTAKADLTCKVCGDEQKDVEATVSLDDEKSVPVSCEEDGKNVFVATATVKDDDENVIGSATDTKEVTLEKTGHKYDLDKGPEFTWAEDYKSATANFACINKDCDHIESLDCDIEEIPQGATCTEKGQVTYKASVTFEEKDFTDEQTTEVEALGHSYGEPVFDWTSDYSNAFATFTCSRCGDEHTEKCKIETETEDSNCTEDGKTVYTAEVTFEEKSYSDTKEDVIPAKGHSYDLDKEPEFTWAEDNSTATATFNCTVCDHQQVETCNVTSEETKEATCTEKGTLVYTAKVTFNGKEFEKAKETDIAELGHSYGEPEFTWTETEDGNYTATATFTCERDNDVQTEACTVDHTKKEATYVEAGADYYTANVKFEGATYSDIKQVDIPKMNAKAALNKTSVTVYVNESATAQLSSEYGDDEIEVATVTSTSIATASKSGKKLTIVGKKAGTTTVTITTASKENVKVTVTVKAATLVSATTTEIAKVGDTKDPAGSTYSTLKARVSTAKSTSLTLKWSKVADADGYIIYGNKCGSSYKYKRIKTITNKATTSYTQKKLKKGTYYKYIVVAYKKLSNGNIVIARSKSIHAVTTGTKYVNPSSVKPSATKVTLAKAGKTKTLTVKTTISKGKKMKTHKKVAFESSNTKVATVSSKGKITAKGKGSCYIYVYAQNGVYKAVKVTVSK